jgi:putative transposase
VVKRTELLQSTERPFHVVNRGVNRGTIYFGSSDYEEFLCLLREAKEKAPIHLLAFALMPNHFHLLLRQLEPYGISCYMKRVCELHARAINRRRLRSGHLFQNRYKLIPLENEFAVLSTSWYIHNNPVKAGLVNSADLWSYSSMRDYAHGNRGGLVHREEILSLLGEGRSYVDFFRNFDIDTPRLGAIDFSTI